MLDRPQQPQGVVAVALEGQHGVDHVLEHPGPGQAAVLGDVADQHGGDAARPWPRCTSRAAHSRTWATEPGRRAELGLVDGLDRVDHHEVGLDLVEVGRSRAAATVSLAR